MWGWIVAIVAIVILIILVLTIRGAIPHGGFWHGGS